MDGFDESGSVVATDIANGLDGFEIMVTCHAEHVMEGPETDPGADVGCFSEPDASPGSKGQTEAATGHSLYVGVKELGAVEKGIVQRLANVFGDIPPNDVGILNRSDIDDVGVPGDLVPIPGELAIWEVGPSYETVDVDVPSTGSVRPLDLQKRTAARDAFSPESATAESTETVVEAVELSRKVAGLRLEGQSDKACGLRSEGFQHVSGEGVTAIASTGDTKAVVTSGAAETEFVGRVESAVDEGVSTAVSECKDAVEWLHSALQSLVDKGTVVGPARMTEELSKPDVVSEAAPVR